MKLENREFIDTFKGAFVQIQVQEVHLMTTACQGVGKLERCKHCCQVKVGAWISKNEFHLFDVRWGFVSSANAWLFDMNGGLLLRLPTI